MSGEPPHKEEDGLTIKLVRAFQKDPEERVYHVPRNCTTHQLKEIICEQGGPAPQQIMLFYYSDRKPLLPSHEDEFAKTATTHNEFTLYYVIHEDFFGPEDDCDPPEKMKQVKRYTASRVGKDEDKKEEEKEGDKEGDKEDKKEDKEEEDKKEEDKEEEGKDESKKEEDKKEVMVEEEKEEEEE